jgi:hypothetical protein
MLWQNKTKNINAEQCMVETKGRIDNRTSKKEKHYNGRKKKTTNQCSTHHWTEN